MSADITSLNIIERIFSNWTALKMAVEHGMGTEEQARNFCDYVTELLSMNEQLHYSDIAAELEEYMDSVFNTKLEDNSETQVAEEIHRFHRLMTSNDAATLEIEIQKLPSVQPWITIVRGPKMSNYTVQNNDNDDNDKKDNESNTMEVDSEGWSVIKRKKK